MIRLRYNRLLHLDELCYLNGNKIKHLGLDILCDMQCIRSLELLFELRQINPPRNNTPLLNYNIFRPDKIHIFLKCTYDQEFLIWLFPS